MSHPSLPMGLPAALFSTQRNAPSNGSVSLAFPVEPDMYEVRLFFAETKSTSLAVGKRVMNISLENATALKDFNVYKQAGAYQGIMKSFTVTSNNVLDIKVSAEKSRPMINGVEITAVGGPSAPQPEPTPDPEPAPSPTPAPDEDGCVGTKVVPGDDLETIVEKGQVKEVFCISSGTYRVTTLTVRDGSDS